MGSPRPNYGRVKGMYDHQGLAGGRRWGPSLGGQINHNSYTNPNLNNTKITSPLHDMTQATVSIISKISKVACAYV